MLSTVFTALFVFEVPKIVFYAPLLLFAVFIIFNRIQKEKFRFSASAIVLAIYTVSYIIFNYNIAQSFYYQSYIHIQAVLMFLIGYNYFQTPASFERKTIDLERFTFAISVMYIAYIAVTFIHYYCFTPADLEVRFYYSIWYDYVIKPATVISMSLVIPFAYGAYAIFFSSKWYKKCIGIAFILIMAGINIYTSTRTLVYLAPVVIAVEFFLWAVFKKKNLRLAFGVFSAFIVLFSLIVIYYKFNKVMLAERFGDTVLSRFFNYGIGSSDRIKFAKNVIDHFSFTYLGGGYYSASCGTPHNIWLYIYDYGGIVTFLIYMVFTVMLLVNFIRFLLNRTISADLKCMLTTVFGLMLVEYFLEPFILPLPSFYILSLFVFGLISGLAKYPKYKEERL